MTTGLTWRRSEWGQYADSNTEASRYYVQRQGRRYRLEKFTTVSVEDLVVVKPGQRPKLTDWHDTAALAKATAEAYDVEPENLPGSGLGGPSRLSRAIERAYKEDQ